MNVDVIDGSKVSVEDFMERYEVPQRPCVIENLAESWPAKEKWTF